MPSDTTTTKHIRAEIERETVEMKECVRRKNLAAAERNFQRVTGLRRALAIVEDTEAGDG